ncbi:peptidoglycan recognition protein [Streptomyces sp. NBC_00102]|uniref:peptidoglycan recognition protein family protein n=1 Tax=Streptomyces sp. NBC_00102 TaxID=2975652 RepID=UPI00224CA965|nr:peptidoglycan recognition protein [Streptomyces sp. NBC_00102]MCX5397154.1 peptidoglycan recognition protein [Streptomyces sp. NBC_00102]
MSGKAAAALGVLAVLGLQGISSGAVAAEVPTTHVRTGGTGAYGAGVRADGPVRSEVHRLALKADGHGKATLSRRTTEPFGLLGVSWTDAGAKIDGAIEARTRSAETGAWSDWITLEPYVPGLDGERPAERGSTEPVWVGRSNGAEVRVNDGTASGVLPAGLRLEMVDPDLDAGTSASGTSAASAAAAGTSTASAAVARTSTASAGTSAVAREAAAVDPGPPSTVPQPPIVTRAEWGADESLDDEGPIYLENGIIKAVFVHHTTDADYNCADSAAIVRAIHVYHVKTNGWRDLGYNFLVDKCGTIFEGRQGGVDQPVMGAHTYGFNNESTSVAILGNYTDFAASNAALEATARVAAYKLGQYGGDPAGTTSLVAGATQTNYAGQQFVAGQSYTFNQISGHRDGFNTECPGAMLYPQLPAIRTLAAGPVQGLKVSSVGGGAFAVDSGYETPGPVSVNWSTSTPTSLISKFELLVDGQPVVTTAAAARTASTTLSVPGVHKLAVRAYHQSGAATTTTAVNVNVPAPKTFVPLTPQRVMDTRTGLGVPKAKVGATGVVTLQVTGTNGVPATGVGAVVLNVTATSSTAVSYISVYPDGTTRTSASNLNVVEGQTVPNLVVVPVVNGKVDFYNNAGSVNLIADITGYFSTGDQGSTHVNLGPQRVMDTRTGLGVPKAQVGPAGVVTLQVAGVNGVPATGVTAVVLNVTATHVSATSFVSVYPDGTTRTSASNLNVVEGQTVPNLVIVPVVNGKVSFYNNAGSVDLIADITGYFTSGGGGASHVNLGPRRVMDTRTGLGVPQAQVGPAGVVTLQVAGVNGVPASGVTAVVLNVTATHVSATSFVSVYPDGTTRTSASNLNVVKGQTVPNLVIVPVVNGKVSFYNNAGSVDLIADITGYFRK